MSVWAYKSWNILSHESFKLNLSFDKSIVYYALSSSSALLMFDYNDLHAFEIVEILWKILQA